MITGVNLSCMLLFLVLSVLSLGQTDTEKNIDSALTYHYNGKTQEAKKLAQELVNADPLEPFFHELLAEIVWKELEKSVASGQAPDKRVSYSGTENKRLALQFYSEIYNGLVLTQKNLQAQPADVKNNFLRGMLLLREAGFITKFEGGISSYAEADAKTAAGLFLLQKSMITDTSLCSSKAFFALAKHSLIRGADESILNNLAIRWKSLTYEVLGGNFDSDQVFRLLDESMACHSDYYWTKDVVWDKKFIYQDILIKQAGRMDDKILPVLEELNSYFPDNKTIRDNLFLVRFHIQNRRPRK